MNDEFYFTFFVEKNRVKELAERSRTENCLRLSKLVSREINWPNMKGFSKLLQFTMRSISWLDGCDKNLKSS